ncbi:hypothetical protein U1Q18_006591 [Sarracenia purpurea var. burkii]
MGCSSLHPARTRSSGSGFHLQIDLSSKGFGIPPQHPYPYQWTSRRCVTAAPWLALDSVEKANAGWLGGGGGMMTAFAGGDPYAVRLHRTGCAAPRRGLVALAALLGANPFRCLEIVLGRSATGRIKSTWAWPPYKAAERSTSCYIPPTICLVASEDYGYRNLVFFLPKSKPSSVKVVGIRKSFLLLRSRDWGSVAG